MEDEKLAEVTSARLQQCGVERRKFGFKAVSKTAASAGKFKIDKFELISFMLVSLSEIDVKS